MALYCSVRSQYVPFQDSWTWKADGDRVRHFNGGYIVNLLDQIIHKSQHLEESAKQYEY